MKYRVSVWPMCAAVLWLAAGGAVQAGGVEHYRHAINTCGVEFEFSQPVSPGSPGTYYTVERDSKGRLLSITTMRKGVTLRRKIYHYREGQQHPASRDDYSGTDLVGRVAMKYNSSGHVIRMDSFDSAGVLTGYKTLDPVAHGGTESLYTAEGHLKAAATYRCSAAGRLVTYTSYSNPDDRSTYVVFDYDEVTGLSPMHRQYGDEGMQFVFSDIYDANGEQTSEVISTPDGTVIAMEEYADTLNKRRRYVDPWPEAGLEMRYQYKGREWPDAVEVYFNGALVCRLKFVMNSDGTVQKTLALDPDGILWAEYPDQAVYEINRDGTSSDGFRSVLHRTGSWW